MLQITEITSEPKQRHILQLDQYDNIELILEFKPSQNAWFYTINWNNFSLNNMQVVYSLNILRQWKNIIPFGIAITTNNLQDPITQDAFSTGVAQLYLLSSDDVSYVENLLFGI